MRLLCFQARRFRWRSFERVLAEAPESDVECEVAHALVAFVHVEKDDLAPGRAPSVFQKTVKHLKWLANKRQIRAVVLHSFTHLGGESAEPKAAGALLDRLSDRLRGGGYQTYVTPFGYLNEWEIDVYGESLAKVWKEI